MSMATPITPEGPPENADDALESELTAVFERHFGAQPPAEESADPTLPGDVDGGDGLASQPAVSPESVDDGTEPLSTLPPGMTEEGLTDAESASTLNESPPATASPAQEGGAVDESPAPTSNFDANAAFEAMFGRQLTQQEAESLLNLYADASMLPQDRGQLVNYLLQGGDPREVYNYLGQQYGEPATAQPQQPAPARQIDPYADDDEEAVIPARVAQQLQELQQTQAQLTAREQQRELEQQQQQQNWYQSEASIGGDEFAAEAPFDMTPEALTVLKVKAGRSGMFPSFLQTHGGNPRVAYKSLLRYMATEDPVEAQRWQEATVEKEIKARLEDRTRQQKASSVSAGGNAAAAPIQAGQPLDRDSARKGALDYLQQVMNDGQPGG